MTTIVDTFNRVDAASLGVTSDGLGTWAYIDFLTASTAARCGIASNQATALGTASGSGFGASYLDTGEADGSVQVTLAALPSGIAFGLAFRYGSSTEYWRVNTDGTSSCGLTLRDSLGFHIVGAGFTVAAGDVIRAEFQGSSIIVKQNGATVVSTTDSTGATNTKHGLYDSASGGVGGGAFDNFALNQTLPTSLVYNDRRGRRNSLLRR